MWPLFGRVAHLRGSVQHHVRRNCWSAWREKRSAATASLHLSPRSRAEVLAPGGESRIRQAIPTLGLQVRLHQLLAGKKRLAGDTDADVSVEVAVGTSVACDSVDQALTFVRLRTRSCFRPTNLPSASRASLQFRAKQRRLPFSTFGMRAAVNFFLVHRTASRKSRLPTSRL